MWFSNIVWSIDVFHLQHLHDFSSRLQAEVKKAGPLRHNVAPVVTGFNQEIWALPVVNVGIGIIFHRFGDQDP